MTSRTASVRAQAVCAILVAICSGVVALVSLVVTQREAVGSGAFVMDAETGGLLSTQDGSAYVYPQLVDAVAISVLIGVCAGVLAVVWFYRRGLADRTLQRLEGGKTRDLGDADRVDLIGVRLEVLDSRQSRSGRRLAD